MFRIESFLIDFLSFDRAFRNEKNCLNLSAFFKTLMLPS